MYNNLRKSIAEVPYFTPAMVTQIAGGGKATVATWLSRELKKNEILRLKRGVYMAKDYYLSHKNEAGFLAIVSNIVEPNSYLTGAWVLQTHAILSESVFSVTAATLKHAKKINNEIGNFEYSYIKKILFIGYEKVWNGPLCGYEATLPKAMFDYFYWKVASPNLSDKSYDLIEDERLNIDLWTRELHKEFEKYVSISQSPKMTLIAKQLERKL